MNVIAITIFALLVSDNGSDQVIVRQRVGWIEHNQVIESHSGKCRLEQIIFWDIDPVTGVKECRGWLPAKQVMIVGSSVIVLRTMPLYLIESDFVHRTRTLRDPEIENRKIIPLKQRRLVAIAK